MKAQGGTSVPARVDRDADGSAASARETRAVEIALETGRRRRGHHAAPAIRQPEQLDTVQSTDDLFTSDGALIAGSDVATSRRDSTRRRLLAVADVLGIIAAYAGVWLVSPPSGQIYDRLPLAGALVGWIFLHKILGLYDRDDKLIHKSTLDELPKLLHSLTLGALLVFMFGPLLVSFELGREQTLIFWGFGVLCLPGARAGARAIVRHHYAPERCAIVGSGDVAKLVARKLEAHPEYCIDLIGFVEEARTARRRGIGDLPMLGDVENFAEICREHEIERVLLAFSSASNDRLLDIVRAAKRARIKITIVPRLFEVIGHQVIVDEVEGMTMLSLRGLSRSRSTRMLKRAIDLVAATIGLILLLPLFAVVAVTIKLTSRGPVFYRQSRMGSHAHFTMYKFRSMVVDADRLKPGLHHLNEADGPMFKIAEDPRVTRVGRFLRKTSLDELPQLWNVVRGEMSLVGPRPLIPAEDGHVIGWHRTRLDIKPGLTGPWQVAGRNSVPFQEMVKMDYLYVAEWSLWNDIRLLLRTAPVVLLGKGH